MGWGGGHEDGMGKEEDMEWVGRRKRKSIAAGGVGRTGGGAEEGEDGGRRKRGKL